ncbi:MAG: ShlB/FhaC/HecB family hemolysin secretion/activation protein [Parvibaculum sp.]|nr:ShlB/FhaC/HecB family hemolysin secretion/activation protein [Parvibaculum sp.]
MKNANTYAGFLFSIVTFALPAVAQDFERIAPKEPAKQAPGEIVKHGDAAATAEPDDQVLILENLKGLRFVRGIGGVVKTGVNTAGLDTSRVEGLDDPELRTRLQNYLGKPLTFGGLRAISREVIDAYRGNDKPLVDVAVPEQEVTAGTVQIVVTEFRSGEVRVEGNRYFSSDLIRGGLSAPEGQPIVMSRLKRDLDWLNRNPFRRVDAVLAKGGEVGTTDITLKTEDRFPLRVYAGYDNGGTSATGHARWSAGFNYGNLFGADQQISYQLTASNDFLDGFDVGHARFLAHAVSWTAPLPRYDLLQVFGSYVQQRPDVGPFFGQDGYSAQVSARYIHPMGGPQWLNQEVQGGFDYKTTNNNLDFGGVSVFSASQDVAQFLLKYSATAGDTWGVTTLQNDLVYSPGGITGNNTDAAYAKSGTSFAKANYTYDTLSLTRATRLPYDASLIARAKVQIADGNLLPSEQLGGGGVGSVRGYDTRAVNGSEGILLSAEVRSPAFTPASLVGLDALDDSAQVLAFWDYARLNDPHTQPGTSERVSIASVGVGLDYSVSRYVSLRTDYGWQLRALPGQTDKGGQANVAIIISY